MANFEEENRPKSAPSVISIDSPSSSAPASIPERIRGPKIKDPLWENYFECRLVGNERVSHCKIGGCTYENKGRNHTTLVNHLKKVHPTNAAAAAKEKRDQFPKQRKKKFV